jgi:hypothetical protein
VKVATAPAGVDRDRRRVGRRWAEGVIGLLGQQVGAIAGGHHTCGAPA